MARRLDALWTVSVAAARLATDDGGTPTLTTTIWVPSKRSYVAISIVRGAFCWGHAGAGQIGRRAEKPQEPEPVGSHLGPHRSGSHAEEVDEARVLLCGRPWRAAVRAALFPLYARVPSPRGTRSG